MVEYRQHQLSNGLQILAECNPQSYTTAFGFFVKAGARDESPEIGGVSHFLEHMVFKGTPNRTAEQVNLQLDEMGSASNARTGEESTIYHATVLPEFQSDMVELLSDIMRPSLRTDDFETEKQVIIEEIKMYRDQPPYGGHEKIMESFFEGHPLAQSVLGSEATVSAMTPEGMRDYFQSRYSPGNMALAAAGNIDFDLLVRDAEKFCGSWEPYEVERVSRAAEFKTGFQEIVKDNSHQQYIIQMAPGPCIKDEERFAMRVLTTILGDDGGSRMYWDFLDSGVAESAGMGAYEYLDTGAILSYICCKPDQAQENLDRLLQLQKASLESGITQKELDLAKRKIASHIVLASERTGSRMFSVGSQWLSSQDFKTPREIAEIYEGLTMSDLESVLHKYPLNKNMTLVVGPQTGLKPAN